MPFYLEFCQQRYFLDSYNGLYKEKQRDMGSGDG